ncbi:FABP family protein [Isoptericola sediminis]|uniref:Ferric nitrobindin-like protein n=1 Tax=Isoptericola sediminis TaxID=2733572 RepID=A0A849JS11_9MICO|nr:FABP family protein [Isoptericola sediminis]NNU26102.1 FABP family protein [Isoptericola sediminis]
MPFTFPEGLAPEVYPLAWLVGRWTGGGVIKYEGIEETEFRQELVFDHDGGPYLRFESTLSVRSGASDGAVTDGEVGDDAAFDTVWSTETGYWRVASERPEGLSESQHPLEVLLTDASGRVALFLGVVGDGRVDLATDFVARTATAAEVTAAKRLYGNVDGRLLWVEELAAFGHPMGTYASGELDRVTDDS